MRLPVIKIFSVIIVALMLSAFSPASAQYLWQLPREESFWAIELSGLYNIQNMDMDAVINDQDKYADTSVEELRIFLPPEMISGPSTNDKFSSSPMYDIKFGMRAWRIHFGMDFVIDREAIRKVSLGFDSELFYGSADYSMSVTAKEYLFYIGYIHPFTSWFEAGIIGAIGPAVAEAHQEINEITNFYDFGIEDFVTFTNKYDHTVESEYIARRIEGRVRFNVTRNVCLDLGICQRIAEPDDMRGERKINGDPENDQLAREYMSVGQGRELVFDYSSTIYSFGITLKNPIESWGNPFEKWFK